MNWIYKLLVPMRPFRLREPYTRICIRVTRNGDTHRLEFTDVH